MYQQRLQNDIGDEVTIQDISLYIKLFADALQRKVYKALAICKHGELYHERNSGDDAKADVSTWPVKYFIKLSS